MSTSNVSGSYPSAYPSPLPYTPPPAYAPHELEPGERQEGQPYSSQYLDPSNPPAETGMGAPIERPPNVFQQSGQAPQSPLPLPVVHLDLVSPLSSAQFSSFSLPPSPTSASEQVQYNSFSSHFNSPVQSGPSEQAKEALRIIAGQARDVAFDVMPRKVISSYYTEPTLCFYRINYFPIYPISLGRPVFRCHSAHRGFGSAIASAARSAASSTRNYYVKNNPAANAIICLAAVLIAVAIAAIMYVGTKLSEYNRKIKEFNKDIRSWHTYYANELSILSIPGKHVDNLITATNAIMERKKTDMVFKVAYAAALLITGGLLGTGVLIGAPYLLPIAGAVAGVASLVGLVRLSHRKASYKDQEAARIIFDNLATLERDGMISYRGT